MFKAIKNYVLSLLIGISNSFHTSKRRYEKKKLIKQFKSVGLNFRISEYFTVLNPNYIAIGNKFRCKERFRLEAIDHYNNQSFKPSIIIGNNVSFNTDIHIGCVDSIKIGDNCMFASRIFITDHDHGNTSLEMLSIEPNKRPLISKGPVVIQNNVWVGEGVAILAGVTIGENSIISTNAVVTKDVPANSVVGGVPAKIIKYIDK